MTRTIRNAGIALAVLSAVGLGAVATASAQGYRPPPSHHGPREIRCESASRRSTYCSTRAYGRVVLRRQLSKTRCREYDTWGADRDGGGVWVWDGCRAIFAVLPWGAPGPGHGQPPPGAGHGPGYGGGPGRPPVRITCKSDRFRPQYCPIPRWGRVELDRRLSDAPCRRYDTWGSDGGGIWVDRGCQAIFNVW